MLQGFITQTQVHLDRLEDQIADGKDLNLKLVQQRTELISPERVVSVARERLGMTTPTTVVYLHPPDG